MDIRTKTIGEIVAEDYRAATIFKKFNIDFCCKGGRTIDEACQTKNISPEELLIALEAEIQSVEGRHEDFRSWDLDFLCDYIENTHHRYVERRISEISPFLDKLCAVHGDRHPELFEINALFKAGAGELASHMKKEELILFPFIRKIANQKKTGIQYERPSFGTVENPIAMMMDEHENEGNRYERIRQLTDGYNPPSDACNTYRITYALLNEFENDLHRHIHLENNILFPAAVTLESELKMV